MSDITIAKLNTLVTANAVQFTQELNRASNVAINIGNKIGSALSKVGVGLSAAGIIAFGKSVIDFSGNIVDLARDAGMGTQAFQTISAVAIDSGVDMEMMAKATENLRSKLQDAAAGAQPVRDELNKLGLSFEGLINLAPEKQWEAISRAIEGSTNKQEAYNTASDLFGAKIGPKLREVFEKLAEGMDKASKATDGLRVSDETLKSLDAAGDKLGQIWLKIKVMGAGAVNGIFNVVKEDFNGIMSLSKGIKGGNGKTLYDSLMAGGEFLGLNNQTADKFNATDGTTKNGLKFGIQGAAQLLGKEMAKGAADYAKAHPFAGIEAENAQAAKVKAALNAVFGSLDEREKGLHDMRVSAAFPQTDSDRLSRLGLLTGAPTDKMAEDRKQTNLLDGIKKELIVLNQKAFSSTATYQ